MKSFDFQHEQEYRRCLIKRLNNMQNFEQELIGCYLMHKNISNKTRQHYRETPCIQSLPRGRPSTRMITFLEDTKTYFDKNALDHRIKEKLSVKVKQNKRSFEMRTSKTRLCSIIYKWILLVTLAM
jgi:hypothetical protein